MTDSKRSIVLLGAALVAAVVGTFTATTAQACPTQADRSLTGPEVGHDIVVNGLPVQIQQVASRERMPELLDRVERRWRDEGFQVKRERAEPWDIVAALSDKCLTTLQVRSAQGQTLGFLAIGDVKRAKERAAVVRKLDVPLPSGAHVVTSVAANDGSRSSTTTVVTTKRSATEVRDAYLASLPEAGWLEVRPHELGSSPTSPRDHVINARRGRELLQIVITDRDGTKAVITQGQAL